MSNANFGSGPFAASRASWIALGVLVSAAGVGVMIVPSTSHAGGEGGQTPMAPGSEPGAVAGTPTVLMDVRAAATQYGMWSRVTDHMHIAPMACDISTASAPRQSASDDESTHGRKLYHLFASDPAAYLALGQASSGAGADAEPPEPVTPLTPGSIGGHVEQVIVKEAWRAKDPAAQATEQNKGDFAGLFVMIKYREAPAESDDGWVYATVAADRVTTLEAGRIASCMGCHENAPHGRLFGLQEY
jgi:hypothetical protein